MNVLGSISDQKNNEIKKIYMGGVLWYTFNKLEMIEIVKRVREN